MNNKGFFISILAVLAMVFIVVWFANTSSVIQSESFSANKAVAFETRQGIENLRYLLDKSAAQALKNSVDSSDSSCVNSSTLSTQINTLFNDMTTKVNSSFGTNCTLSNITSSFSSNNLTATAVISCEKTIQKDGVDYFIVSLEKSIGAGKSISFWGGGGCFVNQITDIQGNYVEYQGAAP